MGILLIMNKHLYIFEHKGITSLADDDLNEQPVIKERRKRESSNLLSCFQLVLS